MKNVQQYMIHRTESRRSFRMSIWSVQRTQKSVDEVNAAFQQTLVPSFAYSNISPHKPSSSFFFLFIHLSYTHPNALAMHILSIPSPPQLQDPRLPVLKRSSPLMPFPTSIYPNQLLFFLASFLAFICHRISTHPTSCSPTYPSPVPSVPPFPPHPVPPGYVKLQTHPLLLTIPIRLEEIAAHLAIAAVPIQTPYALVGGLLAGVEVLAVGFARWEEVLAFVLVCFAAGVCVYIYMCVYVCI